MKISKVIIRYGWPLTAGIFALSLVLYLLGIPSRFDAVIYGRSSRDWLGLLCLAVPVTAAVAFFVETVIAGLLARMERERAQQHSARLVRAFTAYMAKHRK